MTDNQETIKESIYLIKTMREILIREFSYDGEDETGVKTYQKTVDVAKEFLTKYEN